MVTSFSSAAWQPLKLTIVTTGTVTVCFWVYRLISRYNYQQKFPDPASELPSQLPDGQRALVASLPHSRPSEAYQTDGVSDFDRHAIYHRVEGLLKQLELLQPLHPAFKAALEVISEQTKLEALYNHEQLVRPTLAAATCNVSAPSRHNLPLAPWQATGHPLEHSNSQCSTAVQSMPPYQAGQINRLECSEVIRTPTTDATTTSRTETIRSIVPPEAEDTGQASGYDWSIATTTPAISAHQSVAGNGSCSTSHTGSNEFLAVMSPVQIREQLSVLPTDLLVRCATCDQTMNVPDAYKHFTGARHEEQTRATPELFPLRVLLPAPSGIDNSQVIALLKDGSAVHCTLCQTGCMNRYTAFSHFAGAPHRKLSPHLRILEQLRALPYKLKVDCMVCDLKLTVKDALDHFVGAQHRGQVAQSDRLCPMRIRLPAPPSLDYEEILRKLLTSSEIFCTVCKVVMNGGSVRSHFGGANHQLRLQLQQTTPASASVTPVVSSSSRIVPSVVLRIGPSDVQDKQALDQLGLLPRAATVQCKVCDRTMTVSEARDHFVDAGHRKHRAESRSVPFPLHIVIPSGPWDAQVRSQLLPESVVWCPTCNLLLSGKAGRTHIYGSMHAAAQRNLDQGLPVPTPATLPEMYCEVCQIKMSHNDAGPHLNGAEHRTRVQACCNVFADDDIPRPAFAFLDDPPLQTGSSVISNANPHQQTEVPGEMDRPATFTKPPVTAAFSSPPTKSAPVASFTSGPVDLTWPSSSSLSSAQTNEFPSAIPTPPNIDTRHTEQQPRCLECNSTTEVMACGGCKLVYFCSRQCQAKAWPSHRPNCNWKPQYFAT